MTKPIPCPFTAQELHDLLWQQFATQEEIAKLGGERLYREPVLHQVVRRWVKQSGVAAPHSSTLRKGRGSVFVPTPEMYDKARASKLTTPKTDHKIEMICDNCGLPFWEYPKRRPKPLKFCKRACGVDYQRNKTRMPAADIENEARHRRY